MPNFFDCPMSEATFSFFPFGERMGALSRKYRHSKIFGFLGVLLFLASSPSFAQCPEGMVAYWDMDETAEGSYTDRIGGNVGICSENCPRPIPLGRVNGGQEFDGDSSGIVVDTISELNWNSGEDFGFELDFWKNPDTLIRSEAMMGRADDETGLAWWVGLEANGTVVFSIRQDDAQEIVLRGNRNLADRRWHHLAVVRDASEELVSLYVDLELVASAPFANGGGWVSDTAALRIGELPASGAASFLGVLDEIAFYGAALGEEAIGDHVLNGLADERWGYCDPERTIRIMPLGDSITAGVTDLLIDGELVGIDDIARDGDFMIGYRQRLFLALQAFGFSVDFVGSLRLGAAAQPEFDLDNEGHPGWTALEVANSVFGWLTANPADIVLLHIGTNDLNPTSTVREVEILLDEIDRFDSGIPVVLARIINERIPDADTSLYNVNLTAMARSRILKGDKIILVDQESALDYPEDMADDLHPNASGYRKMAQTWFEGLLRSPERPTNQPPVAVAGNDQNVQEGARVFLDGSGSFDPDGGISGYRWEQISGTPVTLENPNSERPSFTAPPVSTFGLVFRLTVADEGNLSDSDEVLVTVNAAEPPAAEAGPDRTVQNRAAVTLDGSGSSASGGGGLSFAWEQVSGPPVSLNGASSAVATFTAPLVPADGDVLVFELTVEDARGVSDSDQVEIRVTFANLSPAANAGPDQIVVEGATVTLDGSGSQDPDGGIARFQWDQIAGSPVALSDAASSRPTFVAPPVGRSALVFRLTVIDGEGLEDRDDVQITVNDNGVEGLPEGVLPFLTVTGQPMGITVSGGRLVQLSPVDPGSISDARNRPDFFQYGLFNIRIRLDAVGGTAQVTFYLPEPAPAGHEWVYLNPEEGWNGLGANHSVSPDRTRFSLFLTDGGFGDAGSALALDEGRIENLSGLGFTPPPVEQEKDNLIGCFIGNLSETRQGRLPWEALILGTIGLGLTAVAGWKRKR
jgi:lysophospholipase L1-like esterase